MIANLAKRYLVLMSIACGMFVTDARVLGHVVSIDNTLDVTADRDHATGELMVPLSAMLTWSANLAGRTTPDKADDQLAYAKAQADKLVKGLDLEYGDVEMEPKVTATSIRMVDFGTPEEDTPQPMVVYKIDFTPAQKIVAPPTEVTFGHQLLAVPEEFQQVDVMVMCFVRFHQVGVAAAKNEMTGVEERVTFKCKWPPKPTSAPAKN